MIATYCLLLRSRMLIVTNDWLFNETVKNCKNDTKLIYKNEINSMTLLLFAV